MLNRYRRLILAPIMTIVLLTGFYSTMAAASLLSNVAQTEDEGQEYVVKAGDWLSKISLAFYGTTTGWEVIVEATNAKAQDDPRFTMIEDPDELEVGQLLWIPAEPSDSEQDTDESTESPSTAGEVMSGTVPSSSEVISGSESISSSVRFVAPQSGDVVESPFEVTMAAQGLTVEPAGEIHEGAGHFHILVDTDFIEPGELLPFDESHLHFGRGQLTTTLELEPGVHTLHLQFANGAHIALDGEQYRDTITVTVEADEVTPGSNITETASMTEEAALPSVSFVAPQSGDVVESPFEVTMAAQGLTVEPAGEIHEGAGHFHILVDTDFIEPGELLPFDESHLHFGRGQLTTTLELEPGVHTLHLQFANGAHIALDGEQYRDTISVTVEDN